MFLIGFDLKLKIEYGYFGKFDFNFPKFINFFNLKTHLSVNI